MPMYMDIHRGAQGLTREAIEEAHLGDLSVQDAYGVRYITYWFNADAGHVFCLVEAPSADAAIAVHRESHGLLAEALIEVEPVAVEAMMHLRQEDLPNGQILPETKQPDPGMRAIMFTDMAGSTAMLNSLGDELAHRHLMTHNKILSTHIAEHLGRRIKATGDGILATFSSVTRAVACSVAIQRAFAEHNASTDGPPIDVRIGLSAGEPVDDSGDLFGAAVNLASRVCDFAHGGCICTVNVVRELCIGKGYNFIDRGEASLKGFNDPVRVYEIAWQQ